jgi:hypothetical protein
MMISTSSSTMRDIDIRQALLADARLHATEPGTRVVPELGLCQGIARVDLAVVNGSLHGYEIKSEHDTLVRLPGQIEVYSRVLDFVTIVTGPSHAENIKKNVPSWWGIWAARYYAAEIRLEIVREPKQNRKVSSFALAQLLWRAEALQVLADRGLADGVRSKNRSQLWHRLAADLTTEELGKVVREQLKRRAAGWRADGPRD